MGNEETANTETVETVETEESAPETGNENAAGGEPEKAAPGGEMQKKLDDAERRNEDLQNKLDTLIDSVARLIESGVQIGGALPPKRNEPPKRTESDEALDHLIKE